MDDRLRRTSKFLSYLLRHDPAALGLALDPGGWVEVESLVERARADGRSLSRARIERVIEAGEKTRFALSDDGSRIRANYGHSVEVDLSLSPTPPSGTLYHGTARAALSSIRAEGLRPKSRQYVHLSPTPDEATAVGRRHGTAVVLSIDAPALHEAGQALYRSTDTVWLTRRVPPTFIRCPESSLPGS